MKWLKFLGLLGCLCGSYIQAQPVAVEVVQVATGFEAAIGLTNAGDGSGRLFVVQQTGEIKIWNGSITLNTPFLDISGLTDQVGEQGLLGLAFHPNYSSNGYFYVNYISNVSGDTVIARYQVSAGDPNLADPNSATPVLSFGQPAGNHNGGDMHFGMDGYLYISTGDGGFDFTESQNIDTLLGSLLRIDVDGDDFPADLEANYAIPDDNPYAGAKAGADEIWHYGFRNAWRFSFDRLTGDLFIGDVGEDEWEEINLITANSPGGENFGWPCFEGDDVFSTNGCGPASEYSFPILALPHGTSPNNNCSVVAGFRYRGNSFSRLRGWYFYTDWCTGTLWAAEPDDQGNWNGFPVVDMDAFGLTGFGESESGELFITGSWQVLQITDPGDVIFLSDFE